MGFVVIYVILQKSAIPQMSHVRQEIVSQPAVIRDIMFMMVPANPTTTPIVVLTIIHVRPHWIMPRQPVAIQESVISPVTVDIPPMAISAARRRVMSL